MEQTHPAAEQFRRWLGAGLTGCFFAARFAHGTNALRYLHLLEEPSDRMIAVIDEHFASAGDDGGIPVALFPRIRSARGMARLIKTLRQGARWSAREVAWRHHPREQDACLVGLEWVTNGNLRSQVMGFAPLGSMPVSRRSPYVALSAWPGGHDNEYFDRSHPGSVSFADAATGLRKEEHDKLWQKSSDATRRLVSDPADDVERMRRVAFCLPRAELMAEDPDFFVR